MNVARLLPLAAIALIGLNLRPFMTEIGPLADASLCRLGPAVVQTVQPATDY